MERARPSREHVRHALLPGAPAVTLLREQRREALLFAIGSVCFALGALPGYASLVGTTADNATYALGSVFFTTASFIQWRLTGRWRPGPLAAGWSDWWSAAVQFPGTLLFNVSTFSALIGGDHVWRPDAVGSALFLVSSVLAVHAVTIRDRLSGPDRPQLEGRVAEPRRLDRLRDLGRRRLRRARVGPAEQRRGGQPRHVRRRAGIPGGCAADVAAARGGAFIPPE